MAGGSVGPNDLGEVLLGVNPDGEYIALNTDDDGNLKAVLVTEAAAEDDGTWSTHDLLNGRKRLYVVDHETKALLQEILVVLMEVRDNLRKG